jgi:hypothetical protein
MKIIAKSGPFRFIAEITAEEIDFLAGKTIGQGVGGYYKNEGREISAGTTFNIVEAFNQIHRNEQRRNQVVTLKQTLELMLKGLEMIDPLIEEPKPQEPVVEVGP